MPNGILIIKEKPDSLFFSSDQLVCGVETFFNYIKGEYHTEDTPVKQTATRELKVWDREPEPATLTGLALFLGFNSRKAFEDYEEKGEFAHILKRGRLRIESVYEKKLHQQSPTGAMFALKCMGWREKTEDKNDTIESVKIMKIELIVTGPKPANNERDVVL